MSRTSIICALWLVLFQASISGQTAPSLRVTGHVVQQSYCYGDAEVFTVPMSIDLQITNSSKKSYYVTDLAPVADHLAISLEEAQHGHYIAELTPTRYPRDEKNPGEIVRLRPGGSAVVHIKYAVVARFKANPPIAGAVPPGRYVLQLDLRTENGFAAPAKDDDTKGRIVSLKTEPISFEIPTNVNPPECKSGTK